ncbi:MAG TPA: DUF971 domain-containing protein [Candidatus Kryptonia bacterium]
MQPRQFKKINEGEVLVSWDDGKEFVIPLKYLRDRCPCASCAGETVLWREYKPVTLPVLVPGKYELESAEVVGNYAIALGWKDGHNTGLYAFDFLRRICDEQSRQSSPA